MRFKRTHLSTVIFLAIATSFVFSCDSYGRTLYAITTCDGDTNSTLTAYNITGEQIEYLTDIQIDEGTIGLALDPNSETLFATYDEDFSGENKILLINAKTMRQIDSIHVSDELSGIVYDQSKQKVYAVSRQDKILYIYLWNPATKALIAENSILLSDILTAYGLALDENNSILYVTDRTNTVKFYDTADSFSYKGSIDVDEVAVGIDFYQDSNGNKYLYTGSYAHTPSSDHDYLVETDINDVNNPVSVKKNVGDHVAGIAADRQTGLIYITAISGYIEIYNNAAFPSDPCNSYYTTGHPADIIVRSDVFYKQPSFYLKKVDTNEPNCVAVGDYITYEITYGPNGLDHNNVFLTDLLSNDLIFISASGPNNIYHPETHTVTWNVGNLDANDPCGSVTLTVKVNECILECCTITNYCEVESDLSCSIAETHTPLCTASSPHPSCGEIVELRVGELNLSWCPGFYAADANGHEIYLGADYSEVYDANTSDPNIHKDAVSDPCYQYPFNEFALDTTYYWRIDEVNSNHPDVRWKGGVWSFTTSNYLVVDDFEAYGTGNLLIRDRWDDHWANGTDAEVFKVSDPAHDAQSMQYVFENSYGGYSEASLDLTQTGVEINTDFVSLNVKSLSLWFYGQQTNPITEQMYVTLTDGSSNSAAVEYPDMNDIKDANWQEWNIAIQQFLDVNNNLDSTDIVEITIGFAKGGSYEDGIVYFDDIRLYIGKCVPGYYPAGDFEPDCDVDFYDFAVLASEWLTDAPSISLDDDNDVDVYDLAIFCEDWLWREYSDMSMMSSGFGGGSFASCSAPPPEQPQPEELSEEQYIEEMKNTIEAVEELQSQFSNDEQAKQLIIEQEGEEAWQKTLDMLDDWLVELEDAL